MGKIDSWLIDRLDKSLYETHAINRGLRYQNNRLRGKLAEMEAENILLKKRIEELGGDCQPCDVDVLFSKERLDYAQANGGDYAEGSAD